MIFPMYLFLFQLSTNHNKDLWLQSICNEINSNSNYSSMATKRVDRKAPSTLFYKFICIFEKCQKKVQIQIQDGFF